MTNMHSLYKNKSLCFLIKILLISPIYSMDYEIPANESIPAIVEARFSLRKLPPMPSPKALDATVWALPKPPIPISRPDYPLSSQEIINSSSPSPIPQVVGATDSLPPLQEIMSTPSSSDLTCDPAIKSREESEIGPTSQSQHDISRTLSGCTPSSFTEEIGNMDDDIIWSEFCKILDQNPSKFKEFAFAELRLQFIKINSLARGCCYITKEFSRLTFIQRIVTKEYISYESEKRFIKITLLNHNAPEIEQSRGTISIFIPRKSYTESCMEQQISHTSTENEIALGANQTNHISHLMNGLASIFSQESFQGAGEIITTYSDIDPTPRMTIRSYPPMNLIYKNESWMVVESETQNNDEDKILVAAYVDRMDVFNFCFSNHSFIKNAPPQKFKFEFIGSVYKFCKNCFTINEQDVEGEYI